MYHWQLSFLHVPCGPPDYFKDPLPSDKTLSLLELFGTSTFLFGLRLFDLGVLLVPSGLGLGVLSSHVRPRPLSVPGGPWWATIFSHKRFWYRPLHWTKEVRHVSETSQRSSPTPVGPLQSPTARPTALPSPSLPSGLVRGRPQPPKLLGLPPHRWVYPLVPPYPTPPVSIRDLNKRIDVSTVSCLIFSPVLSRTESLFNHWYRKTNFWWKCTEVTQSRIKRDEKI